MVSRGKVVGFIDTMVNLNSISVPCAVVRIEKNLIHKIKVLFESVNMNKCVVVTKLGLNETQVSQNGVLHFLILWHFPGIMDVLKP